MKKLVVLGLASLMLVPLLVIGCTSAENPEQQVPPLNGGQEAVTVELSCDDFAAENHITKDVEITRPGSLIVTLCANATTGFQWGEAAGISDTSVVVQQSHSFVEPQDSEVVGAPGKDVWVFDSANTGTATISFSYSRPWEGGEKDAWTLTLNVTVK